MRGCLMIFTSGTDSVNVQHLLPMVNDLKDKKKKKELQRFRETGIKLQLLVYFNFAKLFEISAKNYVNKTLSKKR